MTNSIRQVELHDHSLLGAEAEIRVLVVPERLTSTTEVRGRLVGPTCRFSTTVEVAYHLRPVLGAGEPGSLLMRVHIPEASLWEPECPFLYEGVVELWQDGLRCRRVMVRHGLRTLTLGPNGLRVNGRPLVLRGREVADLTDEQALELRAVGCNLLIAQVSATTEQVWERADRLGFFVLGRVAGPRVSLPLPGTHARHPSCLGWLVGPGEPIPEGLPAGSRIGAEVDADHPEAPEGASFVVGVAGYTPSPSLPCLFSQP
jgi:hypothetical protein